MAAIVASREHEIHTGHRVYGHESKCALLHGHGYVITFTVQADELDDVGRVLDFAFIKSTLCQWLEDNWDHRTLLYEKDPWVEVFESNNVIGVVVVPFNPTAENMASYLLEEVGPQQLQNVEAQLISVKVQETRKCSATAIIR